MKKFWHCRFGNETKGQHVPFKRFFPLVLWWYIRPCNSAMTPMIPMMHFVLWRQKQGVSVSGEKQIYSVTNPRITMEAEPVTTRRRITVQTASRRKILPKFSRDVGPATCGCLISLHTSVTTKSIINKNDYYLSV